MKPYRALFFAASLAAFAVTACAQPKGPSAGASAPGMGMGGGMGGGGMGGMPRHAGADNTYGWAMMTPQEREAHQKKMMDMMSPGECKAYMDKHHQQMADRASQRGTAPPGQPPRDMCEGLK